MNEQDRFALYQRLLESAAAQLGCQVTDDKAKDLACIRLMRETVTLNLIAGRNVDPASLRWLIEELAKFAPPEPPIRCEIEIVDGTGAACSIEELKASRADNPAPSDPPSAQPEAVGFVSFAPAPLETAPAPTAAAPSLEDIREGRRLPDGSVHPNLKPRVDPGSIHDGRLDGVPARMAPSQRHVHGGGGSSNPFSAGRRPDFESAHPLPSPNNWDVLPH
jgi:hypothetical protein